MINASFLQFVEIYVLSLFCYLNYTTIIVVT